MKNFRMLMIASGIVEALGFAILLISSDSSTTDPALLFAGVGILAAGATVGGAALFIRNKEHEVAVRYPAGDIMDVVFFEGREQP